MKYTIIGAAFFLAVTAHAATCNQDLFDKIIYNILEDRALTELRSTQANYKAADKNGVVVMRKLCNDQHSVFEDQYEEIRALKILELSEGIISRINHQGSKNEDH